MIYAYEIKKTEEGYIGHVYDLDFDTKPQPSSEQVEEVISEGLSGVIELKYRKNKKPIPLPVTEAIEYGAYVPVKLQLRILLWNTMLEQHVTQTELAEKLEISKAHMNQFFITDNVSVEKYEEALQVLGIIPTVTSLNSIIIHPYGNALEKLKEEAKKEEMNVQEYIIFKCLGYPKDTKSEIIDSSLNTHSLKRNKFW